MNLNQLFAVATAAALGVTGVVATGPAHAAPARPGVVVDYASHTIKVKPKVVEPYKDLYYTGVKWTSLTSSTGRATATRNVNLCKPDCAAANYQRVRVRLTFTDVKLSDCRRVFSKVKETEVRTGRTAVRRLPVFAAAGC